MSGRAGPDEVTTVSSALDLPAPVVKTAAFGRLEGSSGVSYRAFSYSLPLKVPEGVGGVTPVLSLNYSSQGGNGPMGVGWSLGGATSVIKRCKRTVSSHGVATSLSDASGTLLDTGPFCLDGMLLVPISQDGTTVTFKTEREDFSRIRYFGTAGSGYFDVEKRDGRVLTYGTGTWMYRTSGATGPQDRFRYAWYLSSERFPGRGTINYTYEQDKNADGFPDDYNAARTLTEIQYGTASWKRVIKFVYTLARPDRIEFYEDGFKTATSKRLDKIEMYGPAPNASGGYDPQKLAWSYALNYCGGATGACSSRFTGPHIAPIDQAVRQPFGLSAGHHVRLDRRPVPGCQ